MKNVNEHSIKVTNLDYGLEGTSGDGGKISNPQDQSRLAWEALEEHTGQLELPLGNSPTVSPLFIHNCYDCVYHGRFQGKWDLYYCERDGNAVARYGNNPSNFDWMHLKSMLYCGFSYPHPLVEAAWRRIERWKGNQLEKLKRELEGG